jgi:dTDP-4-amino-4,6-dideoxygalactose transaminase
MSDEPLAIDGGDPVRQEPFPPQQMFGEAEKQAALSLLEEHIEAGTTYLYEGPQEGAYCDSFESHMGGGYADAVNSGTAAVYIALRSLELEPFSEVIVSPITDDGGQMPVPLAGHVPIVADTAPGTYNTGPEQIEACITPRTSAICVSHILGEPLDVDGILDVAQKHDLRVVEDVAQSHGATWDGQLLGTFGDIAAFSTSTYKHHATGGQGGVVYTQDEELYWRARRLADRGKPFNLETDGNVVASLNFNQDDLSAAIGSVQLEGLPDLVERRRDLVRRIGNHISPLPGVIVPDYHPKAEPSYWYWRLGVDETELTVDKSTFCDALDAEGIPLNPRYDSIPHRGEWFQEQRVFGDSGYPWKAPEYDGDRNPDPDCPNMESVLDTYFNVTIYESWGSEEVDDITRAFEKVATAYAK